MTNTERQQVRASLLTKQEGRLKSLLLVLILNVTVHPGGRPPRGEKMGPKVFSDWEV